MEKLQAALEKARSRRQRDASEESVQPASPRRRPSGRLKNPWKELPEIELSGQALHHHHVVAGEATEKATPFDILRTKILLQMRQNNWKKLAITSPMPQSGKSTMACNLTIGLGRQGGVRTMLFDLDLGGPSVCEFFGYSPETEASKVLTGQVDFEDSAVRIGEHVVVLASKHVEHDPTRVLLSSKIEKTLDGIQSAYNPDLMIFDTPSILVGDNTRAFLKNVDCALIVARANDTRYGHYDVCEREVAEHTNVLGTVLNAFPIRDGDDA